MEYISREAALKSICEYCSEKEMCADANVHCAEYADIKAITAADVAPVRHGRWIWDEDGMDWNIGAWRCSECKSMSPMWWNTDKTSPMNKSGHYYCPNCGAKME